MKPLRCKTVLAGTSVVVLFSLLHDGPHARKCARPICGEKQTAGLSDSGTDAGRAARDAGWVVSVVAGSGLEGFAGDAGPATDAALFRPYGICVDGTGNIYFADCRNHRVRRVDGATGVISTVAGNGEETFGGDGGPATSASLARPFGVAVDAAGNLYIADGRNVRIRKVDAATGNISTIAGNGEQGFTANGGPATEAALDFPIDVVVDAAGNVFFTEYRNELVRRVDAATGVITTVAGEGGELSEPQGLALDAGGNLLIADFGNRRVVRVPSGGGAVVEVWAGADIRDVAELPSGDLVFTTTFRCGILDTGTGFVSTFFGGGTVPDATGAPGVTALLTGGWGTAVDGSGRVLLGDRRGDRIFRLTRTSATTTKDQDGDGYSDGIEQAAGSATTSVSSTPFGNPRPPFSLIKTLKMNVKINTKKPDRDVVKLKGETSSAISGLTSRRFIIVVGDTARVVDLDEKGRYRGDKTTKFKGKLLSDGRLSFRVTLKGSFQELQAGTESENKEQIPVLLINEDFVHSLLSEMDFKKVTKGRGVTVADDSSIPLQ